MIKFDKFWQKMAETPTVKIQINGEIKEVKLTQKLLCKITGLTNNVINAMLPLKEGVDYKCKKGNVSLKSIGILCEFFDCQPSDLIEYVE